MGGATFSRIINRGFRELAVRQAEQNPNATGVLGRFFVEVGKKEKEKQAQKQAQSTAATKGAAPMASPNDVDPGPVEYGGDETDQTGRRRRRRQVRGQAIPARRRSLLAEQSDSEMKTKLGG